MAAPNLLATHSAASWPMSSPPSRDPDPPAIANDAAGAAPASQLQPSALRPYTPVREAQTLHDAFTRASSGPSIHAKQVQESAIVSAVRRQLEALDEKLCAHVAREITRVQAQGDRLRETAQARLDTKVSGLDRRLAELSGKCKAISEESQAQIRRMDQTDTLVREWQHELDERVRSKLTDVEQNYQKMNTTSAVAKATTDEVLKRHTVRFVRLEELLEERTAHAQDLSQNVADLHGRLLQLEDPASKSQPQKGDVDKPIKDVAALVGFEKQSFDVQSKVEQLEQELTGFRSNVTLQQEQYKALCARFEAKDEQIKEQLGYKTFTSQLEEMRGRLKDCEEVRTTQTQQLEALQQRLIVQGEHGVPDGAWEGRLQELQERLREQEQIRMAHTAQLQVVQQKLALQEQLPLEHEKWEGRLKQLQERLQDHEQAHAEQLKILDQKLAMQRDQHLDSAAWEESLQDLQGRLKSNEEMQMVQAEQLQILRHLALEDPSRRSALATTEGADAGGGGNAAQLERDLGALGEELQRLRSDLCPRVTELGQQVNGLQGELKPRVEELGGTLVEALDGIRLTLAPRVGQLGEELQEVRRELSPRVNLIDEKVEGIRTELAPLVCEIGEALEGMRTDLTPRVGRLSERLDELTPRVGALEARTEEVRAELNPRVEALESSQRELAPRVDTLEGASSRLEPRVAELGDTVEGVREGCRALEDSLQGARGDFASEVGERLQGMRTELAKEVEERLQSMQTELAGEAEARLGDLRGELCLQANGLGERMDNMQAELSQRVGELGDRCESLHGDIDVKADSLRMEFAPCLRVDSIGEQVAALQRELCPRVDELGEALQTLRAEFPCGSDLEGVKAQLMPQVATLLAAVKDVAPKVVAHERAVCQLRSLVGELFERAGWTMMIDEKGSDMESREEAGSKVSVLRRLRGGHIVASRDEVRAGRKCPTVTVLLVMMAVLFIFSMCLQGFFISGAKSMMVRSARLA